MERIAGSSWDSGLSRHSIRFNARASITNDTTATSKTSTTEASTAETTSTKATEASATATTNQARTKTRGLLADFTMNGGCFTMNGLSRSFLGMVGFTESEEGGLGRSGTDCKSNSE